MILFSNFLLYNTKRKAEKMKDTIRNFALIRTHCTHFIVPFYIVTLLQRSVLHNVGVKNSFLCSVKICVYNRSSNVYEGCINFPKMCN